MRDFRSIHLGEQNIAAFARKAEAISFAKANRWAAGNVIQAYNRFQIFWIVGQRICDDLRVATKDGKYVDLLVSSPHGAIKAAGAREMTNRNYTCPTVSREWFDSRETHPAVATAIFAISDNKRTPEAIWEAPDRSEWDHVTMAIEEYIAHGDFAAEPDGRYSWGMEAIKLPVE